jgi:hypothetical protein
MNDTTEMNDIILNAITRLRHDFPSFTDAERETIRKALWKAWYPAYDADKRTRLDTPLTPSVE